MNVTSLQEERHNVMFPQSPRDTSRNCICSCKLTFTETMKSSEGIGGRMLTHWCLDPPLCKINKQQESIPVGCVPTAVVVATRCQNQASVGPLEWSWDQTGSGIIPLEKTWHQTESDPPWTDRRFWKHYLSLRPVVMNMKLFVKYQET